jgi:NADH dehydrogenase
MQHTSVRQVVILGGGFGGVYTAMKLEKILGRQRETEITLVNSENYFVFQPMLPEVISGSVEIQHIINPIRRLCRHTNLHMREVQAIDLDRKVVTTSPGFRPTLQQIQYDHLVIALGTVMNFSRMPGLKQHAFQFKNIGDALHLRNHIIHVLEEADIEKDAELRRAQLTFVVAGGGFSGVETAAELNDFVRTAARHYRHLDPKDVRVTLIHSGDRILPELSYDVGVFAYRLLRKRGVVIRLNPRLAGATAEGAILENGTKCGQKRWSPRCHQGLIRFWLNCHAKRSTGG